MPDTLIGGLLIHRRQRLIAYAMALALFVVIAVAFTASSWKRAVESDDRQLNTLAAMGSEALDQYFRALDRSLTALAQRIEKGGITPQIEALLRDYQRLYPEFGLVLIANLDGDIVAVSRKLPAGSNLNLKGQQFFKFDRETLLKGGHVVVSRPAYGPLTHTWVIPLRYGLRDKQGKVVLILGAALSQERVYGFWARAPLPVGAAMGVMRDDFYIIARYPTPASLAMQLYSNPLNAQLSDEFQKNGISNNGLLRGFGNVSKTKTAVAYKRLRNYPLTFFVVNPQSNLYANWWASAWPTYVLLLLLIAGGLLIIRWVGRRQAGLQRERERRLEELESLTNRLNSSNKQLEGTNAKLETTNAELEGFMYSISHDFKAPIRAINSFGGLLQEKLTPFPEIDSGKYLERILTNAKRMGSLLEDLLDLSRYSTHELNKQALDMQSKVSSVISELSSESSGVRFEIGNLPLGSGDPILIRQVWINLITNAIKYSSKSSAPVVKVGFENGAYFVADNGVGFDVAYAGKLFKLFSRLHTDKEYSGTGVGLAIVKRIVERHGGHVEATGGVGSGARFSFTLPG